MKLHKKTGSRSSRFPFSGSCLLRQIDDIALDHASRLCAGRIPLGHQCAVVSTADNAHAVGPLNGSQRVAADGACVSVAIQSVRVAAADILALKLCEAIEHRSELLAGRTCRRRSRKPRQRWSPSEWPRHTMRRQPHP